MTDSTAADGAEQRADAWFLASVAVISVMSYVGRLGFYSDEWAFIGKLHLAPNTALGAFDALFYGDQLVRPIYTLILSQIYWLFGAQPAAFHLANTLILVGLVVLLYRVARGFGLDRVVAIAIALGYLLLPHYSATRFWVAALPINAALLLLLGSVFLEQKTLGASGRRYALWKLAAAALLAASLLAYETPLPLACLAPFAIRARARQLGRSDRRYRLPALLGWTAAVLIPVLGYKITQTVRLGHVPWRDRLGWFGYFAREEAVISFGDFGLELPAVGVRALQGPGSGPIIVGGLIGVMTLVYLVRLGRRAPETDRRPRWFLQLAAIGLGLWSASLLLFLVSGGPTPASAGIGNRTLNVAAIGVAGLLVGGFGALSSLLPSPRARRVLFASLVALQASLSAVIVNRLAGYWIGASREQDRILTTIRTDLPTGVPADGFILDGICPYVGPAIVFESNWDLQSALAFIYGTWVPADVVTPNLTVEATGLRTSLYYGFIRTDYPYGKLSIYDVRTHRSVILPDSSAARTYLAGRPAMQCPEGHEGHGVRVLGLSR